MAMFVVYISITKTSPLSIRLKILAILFAVNDPFFLVIKHQSKIHFAKVKANQPVTELGQQDSGQHTCRSVAVRYPCRAVYFLPPDPPDLTVQYTPDLLEGWRRIEYLRTTSCLD